jgi:pimeloyl-[acyl-carrier protein] methyl ester esterase
MPSPLTDHWVLLRGLARESGHWGDFKALLQNAFPNAVMSAVDLPGTGRFNQQRCPRTLEAITDEVRKHLLDQAIPEKPVTLLALSLGGMVAWNWLQRYPDEIGGAVLINTSLKGLNPFYERLRWQIYGKFITLLFEKNIDKREAAIVSLVCNRKDQRQAIARQWAEIQRQRPMRLGNAFNQVVAAATYQPLMKKPGQPVLLLNSKGDRLVAPACSETMQQNWGIPLKTHPWAGHDLPADDGAWVVQQLTEWVLAGYA